MLPNAHLAVIEPSKIRDYLLSPSHPIGPFKAAVFIALGYSQEDWHQLHDDLLSLARQNPAVAGQTSLYGQKFEVSGKLISPSGRSGQFTTVWLVKPGETGPRFVTAFPR